MNLLIPPKYLGKVSDENYTPNTPEQPILDLVVKVMGSIDLDPCANEAKTVPAAKHFTATDNGLNRRWDGKIFLNPPYSNPLPFLRTLTLNIELELISEAIALLKSGTVHNKGTGAIIEQYATAICFWGAGKNRRIGFVNQDGEQKMGADFDCILVYFGLNYPKFREVFRPYGHVVYGDRVLDFLEEHVEPYTPD
jgi:hypothetical protein